MVLLQSKIQCEGGLKSQVKLTLDIREGRDFAHKGTIFNFSGPVKFAILTANPKMIDIKTV